MNFQLKIYTYILLALFTFKSTAQIITTEPAIPVALEPVTIIYDATRGTAGLMDYDSAVYAHTGVLTENSSDNKDWKYAPSWGDNSEKYKMTRVSANIYSLEITPSIRGYYGVPKNETITHMAFVFRSADTNLEGKADGGADIFVEVFEPGLNVSIITPGNNLMVDPGTQVAFEAAASESVDLELFQNNQSVKTLTGTSITHTFDFNTTGDFWVKVSATMADETDTDSVFIHVLETQQVQTLPERVKNGINYIDNQSVTLVLHAPGKEHVFVIGDFNNWTPRTDARMYKDNVHWWVTLDNLEPGKEYAYQYLVDGELYIADPYTEKILDPNNDKWISEATYPDLKDYPSGLASGIVSILQTGQEPYSWQNASFTAPAKEDLVIYELLVRDFIAAHDWNTLTDTLDYLDNLGINAIELMPFNEFEGNESWGYNPSFYFAPDKYYGPKEDLQVFIDSAHGRGMAVIMDMVLNHSYSQSPLVQLYFNETTSQVTPENPWYNVESPNPVFAWGYDFDHESQATKDFIDRVNTFWIDEYKIDGYRFDFTKGFTNTPGDGGAYDAARIAILKRMADQIWMADPDAYVILEHLADNAEEKALSDYGMMLWGNINYNYNEATMGYHDDGKSDFSWISYKKRGWNDPHLVGYMESHDEERLMFKNLAYGNAAGSYDIQELKTALGRMELAGAFFFTIPGPKMIWQFGELGYDFSIDYNGRVGNKPIRWDYFDVGRRKRLYQVWSALIHLRTSEPAFTTTDYKLNLAYATKRIELNHEDMDVRIIGNFGIVEQSMDPNFSTTGTWYEFFSGNSMEVSDPNDLITLAPGAYRIYTTKQLTAPEITAGFRSASVNTEELNAYPNPAGELLFISTEKQAEEIILRNINGRAIRSIDPGKQLATGQAPVNKGSANPNSGHMRVTGWEAPGGVIAADLSGLRPGIYILQVSFKDGTTGHARIIRK